MRINLLSLGVALAVLVTPLTAFAAPFTAIHNPNIVANYQTGQHGVVSEPYVHTGADVVMQNGQSGNFQQWFYGTTNEPGVTSEGDHSLFKNVGTSSSCTSGATLLTHPVAWGSYLNASANYCVKTNDFNQH